MTILWLAVGFGCIWHGAQIIWVAPMPTLFRRDKPVVEHGSAQAFHVFWLDQYAWIGIVLVLVGFLFVVIGWLS